MKKLVLFAAIAALVGCTKESEIALTESSNQRVELSTDGSFDVGTVGANGVATITYNLTELKDICACAVSEEVVSSLAINYTANAGYFLAGIGSGANSYTTFSIALAQDGSALSWADNAVIFTCESTTVPCVLDVVNADTYDCNNTAATCGQAIIGGTSGSDYNACNYPWLVTRKTNK